MMVKPADAAKRSFSGSLPTADIRPSGSTFPVRTTPGKSASPRLATTIAIAKAALALGPFMVEPGLTDRKSTRLNSSHGYISYAVFCLKKKNRHALREERPAHRATH